MPSLRVLGVLLAVSVPPLVGFALIVGLAPGIVDGMGTGTTLVVASIVTLLWSGGVAVIVSRKIAAEADSLVQLAKRGVAGAEVSAEADDVEGLSQAHRRLAASLEDRNRQIGALVELVRSTPIAERAETVAASMVRGARSLTNDPTWTIAVVKSEDSHTLAQGVYGPEPESPPVPIEEVHRWAATLDEERETVHGARLADGPWGEFVVVEMAGTDALRAVMMAPWEGRPPPSPADLNLFSLLGQHAATVLEHAVLYARLRHQTDELNRLASVQGDFLRGVTHDLQTPLTSIGVLANELKDNAALDDTSRSDLEVVIWQADRLRRMVGQLLAVSRLEAKALEPAQEVFAPQPVIHRTWDALRVTDHRMELVVEGAPQLLVADPDRYEQVMWALLDNAVKYSPARSTVRVTIGRSQDGAENPASRSVIAVEDEGTGMDAQTVSRAFDQFFRAPDARRLAPDGSGIGLYAARGLVEAMGGSISIRSRHGVGTTVSVSLPAEAAERVERGD